MSKRIAFLPVSFFVFLVFVIFSYFVHKNLFTSLDFNTTVKIQDRLGDSLIGPFSMFSLFGSVEIASIILLIVLIFSRKLKSIFVLFFYGMTGVIELLGKIMIEHQGPPIMFLKTNLAIHFPSSYIPHEFFSYPSGHVARTAFVSGILFLLIYTSFKNKKSHSRFAVPALALAVVGLLTFDFLMFVSRVYLGEHWTSDVIGGALLGFSLALIYIATLNKKIS